jgi:tetratricopeptide (TPR) repeat protein
MGLFKRERVCDGDFNAGIADHTGGGVSMSIFGYLRIFMSWIKFATAPGRHTRFFRDHCQCIFSKTSMKEILICLLSFCCAIAADSQPLPDSVLAKYKSIAVQRQKDDFLVDYLQNVLYLDNKSLEKGIELASWFKKQHDETAADFTTLLVATKLGEAGSYTTGLNMALPVLYRFEKMNDTLGIAQSLLSIAYCYSSSRNYDQSIAYYKKIIPLAIRMGNQKFIAHIYNDIGATYAEASMPDSGLVYAQKSVAIATNIKYELQLPYALSTVAENYIAAADYDLAIPFLRRATGYGQKLSDDLAIAFINNDLAQAFLGVKQYDSSNQYVRLAIKYYSKQDNKLGLFRSYKYLSQSFEETADRDSANKYFRLAMIAKDSLYSMEKTRLVQSMSFTEQLRQLDIENERTKSNEERKQNIQYALIAISIAVFAILFSLLSRSVITNTKVIEFLGVLSLLIVFEFLNLLLHPFLERVTHHSPPLMLLALVCIAALLIPLHHKLEKWTTHRLVEKNKAIRLAKAKKTIEKLEKEVEDPNQDSSKA